MSFSVGSALGLSPESDQESNTRAPARGETAGAIDTGTQTLLTMPSMSTGLSHLPDAAGENLLIVSPWAPERVESALREHGFLVQNCGLIPVNGAPVAYDGPLWTTDAVAPSDLTGLSMRYSEAMRHVEPGEGWVLVDNAQVLLMYADDRRVARLLRRLTQQAREREVTGVLAVDRGAVAVETIVRLNSLVDDVLER